MRNKKGKRTSPSQVLTRSEKKRRVVLKRVNTDNFGTRSDFLRSGTMAQVMGRSSSRKCMHELESY